MDLYFSFSPFFQYLLSIPNSLKVLSSYITEGKTPLALQNSSLSAVFRNRFLIRNTHFLFLIVFIFCQLF